ncbi:very-long-chain (3R)-3-hydroxyacyl-CoA dehydratase [Malassezia sp. CBS 17886]|nr:very-long-chain (3R)-3-hydroxyacyl-CoA dehydratase [Malassezia sp. CBS 17886]
MSSVKKNARGQGQRNPYVQAYLVLYNLVQFVGWLRIAVGVVLFMVQGTGARRLHYMFIETLLERVRPIVAAIAPHSYSEYPSVVGTVLRRASLMHAYLGPLILIFQTLQALEFFHALFGFVKTSPLVTLVQVTSRLVVLWAVVEPYPAAAKSPVFALMAAAWAYSEVARYPFYVNELLESQSYMALWPRYSFFVLLYPIGATCEMLLIWSTLPDTAAWPWVDATGWSTRDLLLLAALPLYIPGLIYLYTRMLAARRRVLGDDFVGTKARTALEEKRAAYLARFRKLNEKKFQEQEDREINASLQE